MRAFFICLYAFVSCLATAQEDWLYSTNRLFENETIKEATPIVNSKTGEFAIFYKIKKGFIAELYNNEKQLLHTFSFNNLPSEDLVGYVFEGLQYTLFFANASMKKISCVKVDFNLGTSQLIDDVAIDLKGENPIQFVKNELGLHLLTIKKKSSTLKLYTFNLNGTFKESSYDFSDKTFERDNGITYNLYSFLFIVHKTNAFEFIDNNLPCSLDQAVASTKIFSTQDTIILTINLTDKHTYVISLDLKNEVSGFNKIENVHFSKNNSANTHSSFLIDEVLIDSYISNEKLVINFIDLTNNTIIKEYVISEDDSIHFKNSPIILEGGDFDGYRELEKTSQFIRKVIHSKMAISAYKNNNNYVVTLGSYEPRPSNLSMITGGVLGGITGAIIMSMFDSYTNSKSIRVLSLLDDNFNHVQGEIPKNGFDKIHAFKENKKLNTLEAQTIFKYKNHFIWGGFDRTSQAYNFFKF